MHTLMIIQEIVKGFVYISKNYIHQSRWQKLCCSFYFFVANSYSDPKSDIKMETKRGSNIFTRIKNIVRIKKDEGIPKLYDKVREE